MREADETAVQELSRATGVHGMTARALVCRGIGSAAEARGFLAHDLANLADAFAMADMENAVGRVEGALERGVRIRVHGDYDVDGVCATALLVRALRGLGGEVDWHI
ncbi:MAG: single-stranded-DNA-specific exonuclease RecJ, partial [Gemmatimonadales bacterium]|nr:single-stranded-DNA-specific exonuclease RecJ [Gemmatimonadales bacterium]